MTKERPGLRAIRFVRLLRIGQFNRDERPADPHTAQEDLTKSTIADDRVLWMLTDNLERGRDIVDHSGAGVSHMSYDAFGNLTGGTGALLTRYLWTGRERDDATGLQYTATAGTTPR